MKFLVDRCAGPRLTDWLRASGHDVEDARQLGADPGDQALLQHASSEGRVLITLDTDFGALLYVERFEHAGLVLLPDVPAQERIALMAEVVQQHSHELQAGAVVSIRSGRVRIAYPPVH